MMNVRNIFFCVVLYAVVLSCTAVDDVSDGIGSQEQLNLVLSIGNTKTVTRQGLDVIQETGQPFRGLQHLVVLPFTTNGNAVTVDDTPQIPTTTGGEPEKVDNKNYYYWDRCQMMRGTDRVLVWGQASEISGKESYVQNGKLTTTLTGRMYLKDITFSLKSIRDIYDPAQDAKDLAEYMTTIANTDGWSTTDNEQLKTLYLNFIHAVSEGTGLMAGSAAHVKAYVTELKEQLETIKTADGTTQEVQDLCDAIIGNIGDTEATTSCVNNGYPGTLGLPDGAAALRWTKDETTGKEAFAVRTATTTLDNINGITRYTYPAELWYYVDSPIRTSDEKVEKSTYAIRSWDDLMNYSYQGGQKIGVNTQSVAVKDPLQYGVGRLQLTLEKLTTVPLYDAKGEEVNYLMADKLPLTAVIIGGQHTVGYNFKPMGEPSDVDARFIYDPIVGSADDNGVYTVNTLVLQSYDGEKVPVVLEFENKTNQKFMGKDGIIYPNTKFYLIAQIDPAKGEGSNANTTGRVFTQDHTTTMTMKVTSLANAYSCMPDLLLPRLELGIEVVTQWIQPTTTTVIL